MKYFWFTAKNAILQKIGIKFYSKSNYPYYPILIKLLQTIASKDEAVLGLI